MITKSIKYFFVAGLACCGFVAALTSCSDMLEPGNELVEFQEDNTLNHPTDSVYSVLGIVNRMQLIADRVVLLGEARSDLVNYTNEASADLKRLADFDLTKENKYNQVSDYYAVINNCNYYLDNVDSLLQRRDRTLFTKEIASVKAIRAWTYLELVKNYGKVPLVLHAVMTEREASAAANAQLVGITEVCNHFIEELTPIAMIDRPQLDKNAVDGWRTEQFLIPIRPLLGDLCLWAGRYQEAARWYNSYLNDKNSPVLMNTASRIQWMSATEYRTPSDGYFVTSTASEVISLIPMESRVFDGTVSDLDNIFNSTTENRYFYQLQPSAGMRRISADQIYCMEYKSGSTIDTLYAPRTGLTDDIYVGDLRLSSNYRMRSIGAPDPYSEYGSFYQTIYKISRTMVPTYRVTMVYLRYAEALNRAGLPQSAFAVLKYGLCKENIFSYVDSVEQAKAGELISFDENVFIRETTIGIHSRGSGDAQCNAFYVLPQPATGLASYEDTVNYQIPLVEDMIINEMALEGAFEGNRYYDLMRVALRRGDNAYLADPISRRKGTADDQLRTLLMNQDNWYLPLK